MAFDNFWSRAARQPDHAALIAPGGERIAAGDLLARANRLVHGLRALGLAPGDVIAAVLPNGPEAYEIYLAMQQAGWYLVPINYHLVGPEIAYILQDCEATRPHRPRAVRRGLCCRRRGGRLPAVARASPSARSRASGRTSSLTDGQPSTTPVDRALGGVMNYTSGTTGRPKGVRRALPGSVPEETDLGAALVTGYRVDPDATRQRPPARLPLVPHGAAHHVGARRSTSGTRS